jgi:hypothetical protein
VVRVSSKYRLRWDIIIIILAIYNSITIPLAIAFKPDFLESVTVAVLNAVIDLFFLVDIFVNFRTTYISTKTGDEIYEPKLIARRYLVSGQFFIDLLSSVPLEDISGTNNDFLAILGMLKILRVNRVSKVIRNMKAKSEIKAGLKVL